MCGFNHLQATTRSEEERLGVDFADIWQKRQRESVLQAVEPFMAPVATTKQLQFSDKYAKSYVTFFLEHACN